MAVLCNTIVNGNIRSNGLLNTASLVLNGTDITLSSGVSNNDSGLVTAAQVKTYVESLTGTITNNTSGGTSSGTINRGSQIKIGRGFYPNDLYYTAQANSGTLSITTSHNAATNISVNGYANANITGINLPSGKTFNLKVGAITWVANYDSSGNLVFT